MDEIRGRVAILGVNHLDVVCRQEQIVLIIITRQNKQRITAEFVMRDPY